ncbi:MAG: AMP-binding protein [Deltaproteobacteria bacterium]|nr:AMP-binding protein [Deltaproteobacteria bacterium]
MAKNFKAWPENWPKTQYYPDIPVFAFLDQTASRVPNRIAMVFGGMELTYSEFKDLSDRFAAALLEQGVKKGDRVAIHLPNMPQFAIAYYGAIRIGAIYTPVSPLLSPQEARHQLEDAGAETLVSLDLLYPGVAPIIPETPVRRVITTSIADCYNAVIAAVKPLEKVEVPDTLDMAALLKEHEPFEGSVPLEPSKDLVHLAYTGGTTGVSKGVMLTHANVVANVIQYGNWLTGARVEMVDGMLQTVYPPGVDPVKDRLTARDRETALVVVPWFHAMGTVGYLNNLVYSGTTMIVFPRFDPKEYLDAVPKYNATALGGAPQLYIPLVNHPDFASYDLSGIKVAASGAAPLARSVLDRMLEAFPEGVVQEGYGLTECTMGATANPPFRDQIRLGSVGLPVFDTDVKVVDVATGEDLPPGAEGEICIKGPQVMQGYWQRPEATAEVLKDGWLYTGDIGREDEDGFIYITDRKKDMIIYKGYNVYPRQIEEVLFQHPAVQQCAVVGKPDPEGGEIPVAFVELKQGEKISEEALMEHVNSQVAYYKKVRRVIFMDAIPVSAAGKVLKKELRNQLMEE